MFCINCGALLDDDSRFCAECGAKVYADDENQPQQAFDSVKDTKAAAINGWLSPDIYIGDPKSENKDNEDNKDNKVNDVNRAAEMHNGYSYDNKPAFESVDSDMIIPDMGDPDETVGANYLRKRKNASVQNEAPAQKKEYDAAAPVYKPETPVRKKTSDSASVNKPPVDNGFSFDPQPFEEVSEEEDFFGKGLGGSFFEDEQNVPTQDKNIDKKKDGKKKGLIAVGALAAVLVAVAAVFLFVLKPAGSSYFNTYNMSSDIIGVARDADTLFYINENGYIVKMNTDDNERSIVVDDISVDMIYMQGEKLYFRSSEDNYLYMCDFEGDNIEKTVSSRICWFTIIDEELYYIDGYYETDEDTGEEASSGQFNLYKSKLDGSDEKQIINDTVTKVFIGKDSIVYYNGEASSLYKTDADGEERKLLYKCEENAYIGDIKVEKDTVLFTYLDSDNKILSGVYSIGLDGEGKKKIVNTQESSITLRSGKLIYASSEDSCTYISAIDGSDEDDFLDIAAYSPVISGNYMYFFNAEDEKLSVMEYDFKNDDLRYLEDDLYGKTVFTKNYIFYIDSEDSNIYRCDHNGKDAVQLTSGECFEIYSYNDEIYYLGYANGYSSSDPETLTGIDTYGLYKLDTEGESCNAVEFGVGERIAFYEDYVYFTAGDPVEIYRTELTNVDTTASNVPVVTESYALTYGDICFVAEGWIYLEAVRNGATELIRINIDSQAAETVYEGEVYDVQYSGGRIFYTAYDENDEKALYHMSPDGTMSECIITLDIGEYTVSDSIVYYIDPMTGNLCMVAMNGSSNNTLCDTSAANISVYDGKIYFTDRYEDGYTYSVETDGGSKEAVIEKIEDATDKTAYKTHGVDGASPALPEVPAV